MVGFFNTIDENNNTLGQDIKLYILPCSLECRRTTNRTWISINIKIAKNNTTASK